MTLLEQLALELSRASRGGLGGLGGGFRHDPVVDGSASGVASTPYMHGPQGLWGVLGLEPQVISTHVHGQSLAARLPVQMSDVIYPYFAYLTGFTAGTGDDADWDSNCVDPPTAGSMKNCIQTAQFGQVARQTREVDLMRVGEMINRGESNDLVLVGSPLLDQMSSMLSPTVPGGFSLRREVLMRMMELGVEFQRKMAPLIYTGDPANNAGASHLDGYAEPPGLNILINDDHQDAFTGQSCPSLASLLVDMEYAGVCDNGGADMVNQLTYSLYYLERLARQTNLAPVDFVLVMRPEMFYEVTSCWPCSYLTYRCIFPTEADQARLNATAEEVIRMRDAMREGEFLLIGSKRYQVILDDFIPEQDADEIIAGGGTPLVGEVNCFASDIYILPRTVRGNILSTYTQVYNWGAAMQAAADIRMSNGPFWTTDGDRWLWNWKLPVNTCVQAASRIRFRWMLRTPHLAARIQNLQYCQLLRPRQPLPTDSFFVNGGVTNRSFTAPFSQWNPSS
jgi:hypothetical protein